MEKVKIAKKLGIQDHKNLENTKQDIHELLDLTNLNITTLNGKEIYEKYESDFKGYTNHGNQDLFERLKYTSNNNLKDNIIYVTIIDKNKIISLLGLEISPKNKKTIWLIYASVDTKYKNNGLSKLMLNKMFQYIKNKGFTKLIISTYSTEGKKFLKNNLENFGKTYSNLEIEDGLGKKIQ